MLINFYAFITFVTDLKFCDRILKLVLPLKSPYMGQMFLMPLGNYVSLNLVVIAFGEKNTEKK